MSQNFLQEYTDFVDKVTSEASKSSDKMSERIDYLNSKNVEVSRLFTAGIGLSGEVGEFNEIIKKISTILKVDLDLLNDLVGTSKKTLPPDIINPTFFP